MPHCPPRNPMRSRRVIAQEGNLTVVDFGGPEKTVTKAQLALLLGKSKRWIELRVREGMPASTDRKGHRIFRPSECRMWIRQHEKGAVHG